MLLSALYCILITVLCRRSALFTVIKRKNCFNIIHTLLNGKCLWDILNNSRWENAAVWISFTGGFRLYLLPSSSTARSCCSVLSMRFSVTHKLLFDFGAADTLVCVAQLAEPKHNLLVFISTPIGSQVRVTLMITGWFQQVLFALSHQPFSLSWQRGGRIVGGLPGSDATFVRRGHPLISLHLPNKRLTSFLLAAHIFVSQKWMVHFFHFRHGNAI